MFKLWKSQGRLASARPNWSAAERMARFWAKLIGVVIQHWVLLATAGPDPARSHWKAAGVIRQWVTALVEGLGDAAALVGVLTRMAALIAAVAKKQRRKGSPCLFQLLWDPELLDWEC
jgi:hypothetical protein